MPNNQGGFCDLYATKQQREFVSVPCTRKIKELKILKIKKLKIIRSGQGTGQCPLYQSVPFCGLQQ